MNATAAITREQPKLRIRIHLPARPDAAPGPHPHPATELFELRAAAERSHRIVAKPRQTVSGKRKPAHIVKSGSVEIPIYHNGDGNYMIIWYEAGVRKLTRRAKLSDAKEFCLLKATAIANGELYRAGMTDAHRATLQRVNELLRVCGDSPELAASEYAAAKAKLRTANLDVSISAVVDEYIERASRAKIVHINCPDLADQFLEAKRNGTFGEACGARWLRTLEGQLKRFKEYFLCPVKQLTADGLKTWLNSIGGAPFTRKGYRTAVSGLISYAKANRYLPKEWEELDTVPVPKSGRIKKALFAPEELTRLLHVAQCAAWSDKMIPFLACGAFAGVRHEEMNPEDPAKVPLDWRDIGPKYIRIGPQTAKNPGDERYIKMPANLIAWLAPYRLRSGPVCQVANTSNALTRIKAKAKLPSGKGESRNVLRKSWETYSTAIKDSAKDVAEEAGHSQEVGRRHYSQATYGEQAQRWFNILPPETEGVLPLDFRASA